MLLKKKGILSLLLCFFMLLATLPAAPAFAADSHLQGLEFETEAEKNFALGSTKTINFRLYDQYQKGFSGSVSGQFRKPDGELVFVSVSGSNGYYSIREYTFDQVGVYTLTLKDVNNFWAQGAVNVLEPKMTTIGNLELNYASTITVKLTDFNDKPIDRQSVTVDAIDVGVNSATYTTSFDGTFKFTMTPTKLGIVRLTLGGHSFATLEVKAAYTANERIGGKGSDNSSLSVSVAQTGWTNATNVILTRDDVVADAMVAVPLSKKYDAPILMSSPEGLNGSVLTEIRRLGALRVFIIGGTGAISLASEELLRAEGLKIYRLAGSDRYETAAQIAELLGTTGGVYLAYGYGEPDALAASAFAAAQGLPILLTETSQLPASTLGALRTLDPSQVVILGGTGIIDGSLEKGLLSDYSVKRWGGEDRYGTQQVILQNLVQKKSPVYITTALVAPRDVPDGKPFGNALLAAALAAKNNGFVITVPHAELPNALTYSLLYNKGYISSTAVVGDSRAVSYGLEQQIKDLLKR